jgi:hypothetical protein
MAKPQVRIRMYRRLLGDCFLITIGDPKAARDKRAHILIDCGVLQHVPNEAGLMKEVAADLRETVGDYVDLLVITHEHWDHISGFAHARQALIDTLKINELWLAWTERRGDAQADAYRAKSTPAKKVVERLSRTTRGNKATADLQEFNGPTSGKLTSTDIIPALIQRATKTGTVRYLEPGTVLQTPGPLQLRANILGPPRNPKRLTKDLPSQGDKKETYLTGEQLAADFSTSLSRRYALADSLGGALDNAEMGPFSRSYRRSIASVKEGEQEEEVWLRRKYFGPGQKWRSIDNDWLDAAGALALKLDSDTNNTSLTIAFELEPGGDILLFAADAQVGNWLSWHDQPYPNPKLPEFKDVTATVEAKDLLARAVFYKVGHHASHNATLKGLGLELMTHPGLCAMIPVVEAEARRKGPNKKPVHPGWDMPYPDLYTELLAKTGKRLLRGDAEAGQAPDGSSLGTDAAFLQRVRSDPKYHELKIQ